jgi:eukaryotic-like serine/threonine-protein kinase
LHEAKETQNALVFRAKVIEEELVPYKAVDGVIDCLADFFVNTDYDEAPLYFSDGFEIVCDTFPVLRRAARLAELPKALIPDPIERRLRMFASLKDCLRKIGARRNLIVLVDDIQWTDADSLILWADLLAGPNAPRMFHITSIRTTRTPSFRPSRGPTMLDIALRDLPAFPSPEHEISVQRFQQADAEAYILGRIHLGATTRNMGRMSEIARESFGHPLFIEELLEYDGAAADRPLTLEDAYTRRISRLSEEDRPFLEIACCSAKPIPTWIVGRAAGLQYAQYLRATKSLRQGRLIKTGRKVGQREDDWVEPFHSRVQYACIELMSAELRTKRHRAIAETLEEFERTDYELLALEWRDAGEPEIAARYYEQAGDAAVQLVSFKKAAEFFQESLATFELPNEERLRITEKMGRAYRSAGQGKRAADIFLGLLNQEGYANRTDLRRDAAELLIRTGYLAEGLKEADIVLDKVGEKRPRPAKAISELIVADLQRGLDKHAFAISETIDPGVAERLDALWTVGWSLGAVEQLPSFACCARYVTLALKAGDRSRLLKAFCLEAVTSAARGRYAQAEKHRLAAIELTEGALPEELPLLNAALAFKHMLSGEWGAAQSRAIETLASISRATNTSSSEHSMGAEANLYATMFLGNFVHLRQQVREFSTKAHENNDLYALVAADSGISVIARLSEDAPAEALRHTNNAIARWTAEGLHVQHLFHAYAKASSQLYLGQFAEAAATVAQFLAKSKEQRVILPEMLRVLLSDLEIRVRVALGDSKISLSFIEKSFGIRGMNANVPWIQGLCNLALANFHHRDDKRDLVREHARNAVVAFESADMKYYALIARVCDADGNPSGFRGISESLGVKAPDRFGALFAPSFAASFAK